MKNQYCKLAIEVMKLIGLVAILIVAVYGLIQIIVR